MNDSSGRDDDYCLAVDQIKQILARYRPDVTHLHGTAMLSPRILMLLVERSTDQIPEQIMQRLRPLAEAVLNRSELGIAELVGSQVPDDLQTKIRGEAEIAYKSLNRLHAEVVGNA